VSEIFVSSDSSKEKALLDELLSVAEPDKESFDLETGSLLPPVSEFLVPDPWVKPI